MERRRPSQRTEPWFAVTIRVAACDVRVGTGIHGTEYITTHIEPTVHTAKRVVGDETTADSVELAVES